MVLNGENVVGWNTNLFLSNMIIFVKIFDCCEIRSEFYDFLLWNKNFLHILPAICGAFAKPPTLPVISIANNMWQQNISKKKHDSSSGLQTVIELAFVWRTSFQHISAYVLLKCFFLRKYLYMVHISWTCVSYMLPFALFSVFLMQVNICMLKIPSGTLKSIALEFQ